MEFTQLIAQRYSCKNFGTGKVDAAALHTILEAGRLAPTAKNTQEQRIYVVQSEEGLAKIDAATPCRYGAPVCLVVAYDKNHTFTYPGERMNSGMEDAAIVATHLLLGAANAGVDSCWVNFFDPDKLANALGLPENRPALDINAACSGFLYGMAVARGMLTTLGGQYALVIGCEALSRLMDPTDRSTCVLFGDGAGAAIFRLADTPFALTLGARGSDVLHAGGPSLEGSAPITMDGKAVFRFAVDALPKCLHTVLDETRLTLEDLSWVVCHQANSRIIDHCIKALQADPAKFYKNMDRHGNTSAASIPVALNELAESGQLTPGRPLACIGFGGGLTWGGAILQYKE